MKKKGNGFFETFRYVCVACVIALGLITIVGTGGGDGDSGDSANNKLSIPEYTGLSLDDLPETKILDVPTRKTVAGYCYLESFSMQVAFIDDSITTEEVFSFAGLGTELCYNPYLNYFSGSRSWTPDLQLNAFQNYGLHYILGSASEEGWGKLSLYNNSFAKLSYTNSDEALQYLKAAINSGRAVQVHIDLGYMPSLDKYFDIQPGEGSHFILVTGYDADGIYMNETYGPDDDNDRYKNFRIPVDEFMESWRKGGELNKGTEVQAGPCWMAFLEEKTEQELTNKKSLTDILEWQKDLSSDNATTIENNLSSDFSNTSWERIATERRLFGDYLLDQGYSEAGNLYKSLAHDYQYCGNLSIDEIKTELEDVIKPKEIEVRTKY